MLVGNEAFRESDFEFITSTILGSAQSEVTFDVSAFASTYKHLQIRMLNRLSTANTATDQLMRFNGVSSSSYAGHRLVANASTLVSQNRASSSSMFIGLVDGNQFTAGVIDILDVYATKNKTVRCFTGVVGAATEIILASGLFVNTGSITSVNLFPVSSSYLAGSRFSIYGIRG
jgi:hypothetical protein